MKLELHIVPSQTRDELQKAIEAQRALADEAQRIAGRDELTGLALRWRFEQELDRQVAHASRYGRPGALLMIDIDGLKPVNDTAGHQAGDNVLMDAANELLRGLRSADTAARIGGDEFAIILVEVGIEEAEAIAQRLVTSFWVRTSRPVPSSLSVGVTPIDASVSADEVVRQADAALYAAKRAGGNRYVISTVAPGASARVKG